uniref:hypothetical protein n=1 Tax=Pseudomonas aeruginosa TaxID=287 RepID=UPI002B40ECCF
DSTYAAAIAIVRRIFDRDISALNRSGAGTNVARPPIDMRPAGPQPGGNIAPRISGRPDAPAPNPQSRIP